MNDRHAHRGTIIVALPAFASTPARELDDADVTRRRRSLAVTSTANKRVDVFVADRPDAMPRMPKLVAHADREGRLILIDAGSTRRYFLRREAGQKMMIRTAERLVLLAQGSNFRDIGGCPAGKGKHVRWGVIYRSGATPFLPDDDIARIKALGLKNMVICDRAKNVPSRRHG